MATAGMQPPGKADIPQSGAVQLPGYKKNFASLDMHPIPKQERQKSSENTHTHTHKQHTGSDYREGLVM